MNSWPFSVTFNDLCRGMLSNWKTSAQFEKRAFDVIKAYNYE